MKLLTSERQRRILAALAREPVIKSQDLMRDLEASESTIRRDLDELEAAGKLRRIHGGAERLNGATVEPSVQEKANQFIAEKQAIAQAAVTAVQSNCTLFLDAGTTTAQLIPLLAELPVTVVTTGVDNASLLADHGISTLILGGRLKSATKATVGAKTVSALQSRYFDIAFIGTNGVHPQYGLTTPDEEEAMVKQTAIAQAKRSIVLADPSKFGQISYARFASVTGPEIITTAPLAGTYKEFSNIREIPFH